MDPSTLTVALLSGLLLSGTDSGEGVLTLEISGDRLREIGGPEAVYEAATARDDLCERFDTFRLAIPGPTTGLQPGEPDPALPTLVASDRRVAFRQVPAAASGALTVSLRADSTCCLIAGQLAKP